VELAGLPSCDLRSDVMIGFSAPALGRLMLPFAVAPGALVRVGLVVDEVGVAEEAEVDFVGVGGSFLEDDVGEVVVPVPVAA
jgi:hypothetical protein